jgi:hypothetical protein
MNNHLAKGIILNEEVKFGDWFTWEAHDDYVNEAIND